VNTSNGAKHTLLGLAIFLIIAWIALRVGLAVTSAALHLLWVVAIVMFVFWLIEHLGQRKSE
jgi:hypothetical protein